MLVEPYLSFEGRCEEALEFYKDAIDASIGTVLRYSDNPQPPAPGTLPPNADDKVMHSTFRIGDTTLMASDGHCSGQTNFSGITLTITVQDPADAERVFNALAKDGCITMPLGKTFFSPSFGMLDDKFGVSWMILTCVEQPT